MHSASAKHHDYILQQIIPGNEGNAFVVHQLMPAIKVYSEIAARMCHKIWLPDKFKYFSKLKKYI